MDRTSSACRFTKIFFYPPRGDCECHCPQVYVKHLTDRRRQGVGRGRKRRSRHKAPSEEVQSRLVGLGSQSGGVGRESEHYLRRLYRLTIGASRHESPHIGSGLAGRLADSRQSTIGSRSGRVGVSRSRHVETSRAIREREKTRALG